MRQLMLLFLACTLSPAISAQDTGIVKGVVINENDEPIMQARVHLEEDKPFSGHRIINMFETDKQGEFEIRGLPWGRYVVLAGKEEDGYPDTKSAFYSNLSVPRVLIGPNLPVPYVTVKLGPKAGLLEIKSVMNADTGAVLSSASLTVRRAENEFFLITSAVTDRVVQIPPGIDVFVGVSAPGYKLWTPLNSDGKPEKLRLKPGEIRRLAVQLQPEAR